MSRLNIPDNCFAYKFEADIKYRWYTVSIFFNSGPVWTSGTLTNLISQNVPDFLAPPFHNIQCSVAAIQQAAQCMVGTYSPSGKLKCLRCGACEDSVAGRRVWTVVGARCCLVAANMKGETYSSASSGHLPAPGFVYWRI